MNVLTFDIETIVDESRLALFDADLAKKANDSAKRKASDDDDDTSPSVLVQREIDLLGATTPEYLQIIGMNLGVDEEAPRSGWVGEVRNGTPLTEVDLLQAFWTYARQAKHLVGFNCSRFDLPAIYVRSALLGVEPSVYFYEFKPWDWKVIDLMHLRWPYRAGAQFQSLKALRRILQLPTPEKYDGILDMTGADVGALWQAGDYEKCRLYGESDVVTTRELARHWQGYFFPVIMEKEA